MTISATEVDGSVTNEAWTIDGDDVDTEVISNQTVKFQGAGITTTDYNPTYVSQILNGHREFRDVARRNMARRAGLPADFFDAVGVNEPEAHYGALDADIAELTLIMRRTDPQTRRDILGAARLLAAQAANPSPSARRHGT
jgi:hypothetical protein